MIRQIKYNRLLSVFNSLITCTYNHHSDRLYGLGHLMYQYQTSSFLLYNYSSNTNTLHIGINYIMSVITSRYPFFIGQDELVTDALVNTFCSDNKKERVNLNIVIE